MKCREDNLANIKRAIAANVDGQFYVDDTCINCGVSRHYAPTIFGDTGTHACVKKQPGNEEEMLAAMQALLACPVSSIGTRDKLDLSAAKNSFPLPLAKDIYINGFNHRDSYGAHSYFIVSKNGNWLVDSPRFTSHLVEKMEAMGGVRYILLTHRDDVCDAPRYAKHFGAERIIHQYDADAQKDAEIKLQGDKVHYMGDGEIHFTPGHTRGHIVLLWQSQFLFTGDHYAWLSDENRFGSFRDACWYSWEQQIDSVQKMTAFQQVEWVFPGHGKWGKVEKGQFPNIIRQSVEMMRSIY